MDELVCNAANLAPQFQWGKKKHTQHVAAFVANEI
jgi:hypothetical protein